MRLAGPTRASILNSKEQNPATITDGTGSRNPQRLPGMPSSTASGARRRGNRVLSKKAKYALKAMLYLAHKDEGQAVLIAEIAREENIPLKFLESILLQLRNSGLCASRKGRGGGYALARPAAAVSFGEIVRIMDGPLAPVPCVSVTSYRPCEECRAEKACEIRHVMKQARDSLAAILDSTSLDDAIRAAAAGRTAGRPRPASGPSGGRAPARRRTSAVS